MSGVIGPAAGFVKAPPKSPWRWYFNRLRCMSVVEILRRTARRVAIEGEKRGLSRPGKVPKADLAQAGARWLPQPAISDAAPYLQAADRLVTGRFNIFALRNIELGSPPKWNRDCKTGVEAPLVCAKLIDYRDSSLVGDIKYLWEPNRHQHLVTLAQAYALSGQPIYLETIREHLRSWFTECPEGLGPNWSSSLEAGLRLISWSITWQLVGGLASPLFEDAAGEVFRDAWLDSIYRHQRFIAGYLSRDSSANNHLIGELVGLFVGALTWPHWPATRRWARYARSMLEREILRQNANDGVNREQAVAYQHFELDLLLAALLIGQASRLSFSQVCQKRIEAMFEYLASIIDTAGNVPMFGDSDDAVAMPLAVGGASPYRALLATGAIIFKRGEFKALAQSLDDKTRWLLGAAGEQFWQALPAEAGPPIRRSFRQGGYFIMGSDFGTAREVRLIADAGPLGYPRIAAHGHADALSFTLSIGGYEFLVDPGTYAYHTESVWRDYFRGTSAHNTLRVDGRDQSESGGNFMWLNPAHAACKTWRSNSQEDIFSGWHDGYMSLPDPVLHRRLIVFDKIGRQILIEDRLKMAGEHLIELFFHADERCQVDQAGENFIFQRDGLALNISLPAETGSQATLLQGSVAPIAGWVSRRFDEKTSAPTLRWAAHLQGEATLRTLLTVVDSKKEQALSLAQIAHGVVRTPRRGQAAPIAPAGSFGLADESVPAAELHRVPAKV